jgi:hypothetical protein
VQTKWSRSISRLKLKRVAAERRETNLNFPCLVGSYCFGGAS